MIEDNEGNVRSSNGGEGRGGFPRDWKAKVPRCGRDTIFGTLRIAAAENESFADSFVRGQVQDANSEKRI